MKNPVQQAGMKELKLSFDARIDDLHLQVGDFVKVADQVYKFVGRELGARDQFGKLIPGLNHKYYDVLEPIN